ncbi:hypothetical protein PhCBS80983_g04136 [Powellomyces hirtus]|uniref:Uncharacterized protein n=1 Tax=Powellomyces hirtus TaxID=109895 RepID=A0A507DZP8_9FUNG|nr:hypothetical protein PhCBS80983_g04136 [Powellomyces hirtus]
MSAVIRLMDSSGQVVLDSVATDYEDSFSLESFDDLIKAHRECDPAGTKEFIIARVQTWDHKQPEKAFYSYYSAYQLNKILIKTQRYKGKRLIHRLHVLNPLTNTDIIGNVQYFHVQSVMKKNGPLKAVKEADSSADLINRPQILGTAEASDLGTPGAGDTNAAMNAEETSDMLKVPTKTVGKKRVVPALQIQTGASGSDRKASTGELAPMSPSVQEVESGLTTWTRSAPSAVEAPPDEDDLLIEEQQAEAASSTMTRPPQGRKRSIFSAIITPRRKSQATASALGRGTKSNTGGASEQLGPGTATTGAETGKKQRPHSAGDFRNQQPTTSPPTQIAPMSAHPDLVTTPLRLPDTTKIPAPPGQITRFAIPVPTGELNNVAPPTNRNRRRTLSYHNSIATSGMTHASFEDWLSMMHQEKRKLMRSKDTLEVGAQYDVVKPFGKAGTRRNSAKLGGPKTAQIGQSALAAIAASPTDTGSPSPMKMPSNEGLASLNPLINVTQHEDEEEETSTEEETEAGLPYIYDAWLFATDIDFLESSAVRARFRENALSPEDSKLFELPAVPRDSPTGTATPIQSYDGDTCWCC